MSDKQIAPSMTVPRSDPAPFLARFPVYLACLVYGLMLSLEFGLWVLYVSQQSSILTYAYPRDFQGLYVGVRLILDGHGSQLYDLALQQQTSDAVIAPYGPLRIPFWYPAYTALLLVPLGFLSYAGAYVAWTCVNLSLTLGTLWWLARSISTRRRDRLLIGLAMLSFPPLFHMLWQGQTSMIPLLSLTGAVLALRAGQDRLSGLWLILGLLKPQTIVLPLLALVAERRWRTLAYTAAGGAGLTISSLLLFGNWIPGLLAFLRQTVIESEAALGYTGAMPNWQGLVYQLLGTTNSLPATVLYYGLVFFSIGLVTVLNWRRPRLGRATAEVRFAVAVLLGLMIVPHLYIHDIVIDLLPGALLWQASTAALAVTPSGRLHLLRWLIGLGPLVFYVMQFWHPPLIQLGSWYIVVVLLVVLWCWNVLSVPVLTDRVISRP